MQSLCTLRNHCRQWPRNTRYQADATPYLGRTSTGWIAPACLAHSFDHLVGSKQKLRRDGQAKCLGGLQIDHEIVLGRLLVGQITRLLAAQDAVDVGRGTAVQVSAIRAVAICSGQEPRTRTLAGCTPILPDPWNPRRAVGQKI